MPFPLAHPAAVLPLHRFCPRHLIFSALMIGSTVPDIAYCIDDLNNFSGTMLFVFGPSAANFDCVRNSWDWDDLSHTFAGSIGFCLPLGLVFLAIFLTLRQALVALLPNPHRDALTPLCDGPKYTAFTWVISLLIGIWLHIGWDSLTNGDRWLAQHWAFLHIRLAQVGGAKVEVYRALWWLSSLGGTVALIIGYTHLLRSRKSPLWVFDSGDARRYLVLSTAVVVAALVAFPTALHFINPAESLANLFNFCHRFAGYHLAAFCACLTIIALFSRMKRFRAATQWK